MAVFWFGGHSVQFESSVRILGTWPEAHDGRARNQEGGQANRSWNRQCLIAGTLTVLTFPSSKGFFLTIYFVLPRYTPPPHPLGEAGVRKHWSTKYKGFTVVQYIMKTL